MTITYKILVRSHRAPPYSDFGVLPELLCFIVKPTNFHFSAKLE